MRADKAPSVDPEELRGRINSRIARYKETCSAESLDELFEVLLTASTDLPDRAHALSQLSAVRLDRFRIRGDAADLAGAVASARSSLALTAPGQTLDRLMRQVNLGAALLAVTSRGGAAELSEAVELLREASEGLPAGSSERAVALANLCDGLQLCAERTGDPQYVEDAIAVGQEAAAAVSGPSGEHSAILTNYANALRAYARRTANYSGLDSAIQYHRRAVSGAPTAMGSSIPIAIRLAAAQAWGEWAGRELGEDHSYLSQAAEGYALAVSLLPALAWRGLLRTSQERALARQANLPGLAAAYATEARLAEHAVAILELGRSVLWRQLIDITTDLEEVRRINPNLAQRMTSVRSQLDQLPADRA